MKLRFIWAALLIVLFQSGYAQTLRLPGEDEIRCYTMESDAILRANHPELGTLEDFERWITPKVEEYNRNASAQRAVITIPIVFHIIHNNGADNLNAAYINAQIAQLNEDFRKLGAGSNSNPVGADSEIEFCAATVDPNGNTMAEPGIDRVNRSSKGFTAPPYSQNYYESTIKPSTIWDPTKYCNVWVSNLSGGLLGYAQFPEAGSLPGIGTGNGSANTDGVVVLYTSVGSVAYPHPSGGVYAAGRTLTHELGHWLGLRHIWGDGGCNVDDYCNDTPRASSATSGCPTKNTCNDISYGASSDPNDMVQNYMDYSYDNCMNIFTQDQKARMQVVMASSVRRASLVSSGACGSGGGGGGGETCTSTVSSFPYSNGFENTLGNWTQSTSDDFDWTLNSGSTASSNTGPSSAAQCSYYLYMEASSPNYPSKTAIVNSPCFALPSGQSLSFEFQYHMYGASTMGSLQLQARNDGSSTWSTLWSQSGNQGNSWLSASVDISSLGGGTVQLRFTASTASTWQGDIAIDDIALVASGGADTQNPSVPGNLTASNITTTTADLSWTSSTDNVGVTGYDVYLGGSLLGTVTGTSASLSGLTPSTTYTASVRAKDAAGNQSSPASVTFTTLTDVVTCVTPSITISITMDNYPEETSWAISGGGGVVASGGPYGSVADGSTVTETVVLNDGNYTFTIYDSYGDGICCAYGNGSYTVSSGGTVIATGASFSSSESTDFCTEGLGGADTQPPTAPSALIVTNISQTSADVSWTASEDNVGVASYNIYLDGSYLGNTNRTNTSLTGLTESTTYTVSVTALDFENNESTPGSATFTTLGSGGGGGGSDLLFGSYFETGWDGWIDGGSDCGRVRSNNSPEGFYSILIRDNSGTASSMTRNNVDVTGYDQLVLEFYFYANGMQTGEDFWFRVNDGSGWQTVAAYVTGTDFNNGGTYVSTITLDAASYSFNSGFDLRFQCDASANNDQIYIDAVTLTGVTTGRLDNGGTTVSVQQVGQSEDNPVDYAEEAIVELKGRDIVLYPNPASDMISVVTSQAADVIRVFSVEGALVSETKSGGEFYNTLDVSRLDAGTYIIQVYGKDGSISVDRFIKY